MRLQYDESPPRTGRLAALALLSLLTTAGAALAEVIVVDTNSDRDNDPDTCELREAIRSANGLATEIGNCAEGDTGLDQIEFAPNVGYILLESDLQGVEDDLLISGPGVDQLLIDGDDQYRLFTIGPVSFEMSEVTLSQGLGSFAGGIYGFDPSPNTSITLENMVIESCTGLGLATPDTGGLYAAGGDVTIRQVLFQGNRGRIGGAGAVRVVGGTLSVEDSLFLGNQAYDLGGAIQLAGTVQATVTRSTFVGNTAGQTGSAIAITSQSAALDLSHSTHSENTGQVGGGVGSSAVLVQGTFTIANTVIAGNIDNSGQDNPDLYIGSSTSTTNHGYNLIGNNTGSASTFPAGVQPNGDMAGTSASPLDPQLESLADNGGFTQSSAPQSMSPLVDQGSCTGELRDQRGFHNRETALRSVDDLTVLEADDGCDIGAIELGAEPPTLFFDGFESGDTQAWS